MDTAGYVYIIMVDGKTDTFKAQYALQQVDSKEVGNGMMKIVALEYDY